MGGIASGLSALVDAQIDLKKINQEPSQLRLSQASKMPSHPTKRYQLPKIKIPIAKRHSSNPDERR
jgi:hypothetical protein